MGTEAKIQNFSLCSVCISSCACQALGLWGHPDPGSRKAGELRNRGSKSNKREGSYDKKERSFDLSLILT
jgi:hypothetical protein